MGIQQAIGKNYFATLADQYEGKSMVEVFCQEEIYGQKVSRVDPNAVTNTLQTPQFLSQSVSNDRPVMIKPYQAY